MCKSLLKIYTKERQKRFYNFIAKLLICSEKRFNPLKCATTWKPINGWFLYDSNNGPIMS